MGAQEGKKSKDINSGRGKRKETKTAERLVIQADKILERIKREDEGIENWCEREKRKGKKSNKRSRGKGRGKKEWESGGEERNLAGYFWDCKAMDIPQRSS